MKGAQAEDRYTEEDRPTRGRQTYSENGLHGDEDRAELRDRVRPMQDKSHEVPLRRIPLTRMRGLRAWTGSNRRLVPCTALPNSSRHSMTFPCISKRLYVRRTNPGAHDLCLNFISMKNPHLFRGAW